MTGEPRGGDPLAVIPIRLPPASGRAGARPRTYQVANVLIVSELPLEELSPFATPALEGRSIELPPATEELDDELSTIVFSAPGWIGGELRRVESRAGRDGYELEIPGTGLLRVSAGSGIECLRLEPEGREGHLAEALLGPALILALALRDVYCLHAAAVAQNGLAVALAGSSGHGKSTLAAGLGRAEGWRRIADDVLPVAGRSAPSVLPRFPQLKLAADQQVVDRPGPGIPLAAVCLLEPPGDPGGEPEEVRLEPLPPAGATWALCRHTVAGVLFGGELKSRHLSFCGEVAAAVPVYRLVYPHLPESISRSSELILGAL